MGNLSIRSVSKQFRAPHGGATLALDDVSLEIAANECFVLLGPSGCGKTTLLRCIAGLENPDSGEIWLSGERLDTEPPFRRKVNTVFQSYALFPHLNVADNIAFGLEMDGRKRRDCDAAVSEMLRLVNLEGMDKRVPNQLSGGQQQRVALARALAKQPDVLLLDEPLAALDLKLRRSMQFELKALQARTGITFVFVTHDQDEALALGDRIAVFSEGTIRQVGTPRQIYDEPASRFVADFIGETNVLPLIRHGDAVEVAGQLQPASSVIGATDSDAVALCVRPENVRIDPAGALSATVSSAAFLGSIMHYSLTLGDGTMLRMNLAADATEQPTVGSSLHVSLRHLRAVGP